MLEELLLSTAGLNIITTTPYENSKCIGLNRLRSRAKFLSFGTDKIVQIVVNNIPYSSK